MKHDLLSQLATEAQQGKLSWSELAEQILAQETPAGSAHHPDLDRRRRCGFGEVIFGSGKSAADVIEIARELLASGQREVLVTRVAAELAAAVQGHFARSKYDDQGRTLRLSEETFSPALPSATDSAALVTVTVVTAGSTDLPVAREALETLHWMGVSAELLTDVGVAGPYRLLAHLEQLRSSVAVVVVAGMEGALASVVGGLVPCPVIAVPTSVGYGANFEGITTLLSMLSSCAAGVTAVNIDAGFKGGYIAGLIAAQVSQARPSTR
ncbi:nickel pincer cofactor biosynthesis protein LarB [Aureliella helgolandensis]|uniref:AIR carboxylase n=1 Tax=Aureliella helgolandensis TaxID=2527968 RepID=A0A518GFA5_9BACT|nr:nickel pincer cofactor biosynthesis protein LarB [Aureliella helgolandensis]QDV27282.1 AIR carboxylase [Aureliella helgolandensis]